MFSQVSVHGCQRWPPVVTNRVCPGGMSGVGECLGAGSMSMGWGYLQGPPHLHWHLVAATKTQKHIQLVSGQYASYWNAFLFMIGLVVFRKVTFGNLM